MLKVSVSAALCAAMLVAPAVNADVKDDIRNTAGASVKTWIADPVVIEAIKAQNAAHSSLSQADIDKLDKQWRAETKSGSQPMIEKTLNHPASVYLKTIQQESEGLYTEIFVMDNKGLNVAQSEITSDYWQGDEAKWKQTFMAGAGSSHVSDVEMDESTQVFQAQLSLPVVDPADNAVIGAVTIGVNVDGL